MARELLVQELTDSGTREVARLRANRVPVGREASDGLMLPVDGVSRNHGCLIQGKNNWLYSDTGSTNGSWINGDRVFPGTWKVLRSGDTLQISTVMLRITESDLASRLGGGGESGRGQAPQALIVVQDEQVRDEFPVPEIGQALVIGGPGSDLALEHDSHQGTSAIVEKRDGELFVVRQNPALRIELNGEPVGELGSLLDNDQISVEGYKIIVVDPRGRPKVRPTEQLPSHIARDDERARPRQKLAFGQAPSDPDSVEATQAIDPATLEELRRGYKIGSQEPEAVERYAILEDSLIMILGIGLLGALVGILVWWILK